MKNVGQLPFTKEYGDEEEETDSKFGPVVDHTLTPWGSALLAALHGGSTVGALGAVSEASVGESDVLTADDLDTDTSAASDRTDCVNVGQM